MLRVIIIAFLLVHGFVHLNVWARRPERTVPDPGHSWLLGDQRSVAVAAAFLAAGLLILAGIGLWAHAHWWRTAALAGLCTSFGLMVLYFNPWFLPIQVVNAAAIAALVWLDWPSHARMGT